MGTYDRVSDIVEIILCSVAQEVGKSQEQLTVEVESVVTRGVLEAFKRGREFAHDRDTPRKLTPARLLRKATPPLFGSVKRDKDDD